MSTEREKREAQEKVLYANYFTRKMIETGKTKELVKYLETAYEDNKNGMTADEIHAVEKRALNAANVYNDGLN